MRDSNGIAVAIIALVFFGLGVLFDAWILDETRCEKIDLQSYGYRNTDIETVMEVR